MSGRDFIDEETNVNSDNHEYTKKIINDDDQPIHFNKNYKFNHDKHLLHTSPKKDNSNLNPTEQIEIKNTKDNKIAT